MIVKVGGRCCVSNSHQGERNNTKKPGAEVRFFFPLFFISRNVIHQTKLFRHAIEPVFLEGFQNFIHFFSFSSIDSFWYVLNLSVDVVVFVKFDDQLLRIGSIQRQENVVFSISFWFLVIERQTYRETKENLIFFFYETSGWLLIGTIKRKGE